MLAGKTHHVLTAVAIGHNGKVYTALSRSSVQFAPMTSEDIHCYVDSQEPMGKAGAYAVQVWPVHLFKKFQAVILASWVYRFMKPVNC